MVSCPARDDYNFRTMAIKEPKSVKAQMTRASLVVAAAAILRDQGPAAVSYRKVAATAGVSSSSTLYYFDSLSDLLTEAGRYNIEQWATRAERTAAKASKLSTQQAKEQYLELILEACLPHNSQVEYSAHYSQLLAASASSEVTGAYAQGRQRLDTAVAEILEMVDWYISPSIIIALVDGAAVAAISEGRSVPETVSLLLKQLRSYTK